MVVVGVVGCVMVVGVVVGVVEVVVECVAVAQGSSSTAAPHSVPERQSFSRLRVVAPPLSRYAWWVGLGGWGPQRGGFMCRSMRACSLPLTALIPWPSIPTPLLASCLPLLSPAAPPPS